MGTLREKKYVMLGVVLMTLIPGVGLSQRIDIVNYSEFSVAGNGSANVANYGEAKFRDAYYNYVSPSSYGGNDVSDNNIITVSSSVTGSIYRRV